MKIKGIILDIDGVLIGQKNGFNFPQPNSKVIEALKNIKTKGIVVSLCTAKPYFSIENIVQSAKLDNQHITNGGSLTIDPINNAIAKCHNINPKVASRIISDFIENNVYVEFYTKEDYFIQKSQVSRITKRHTEILKRKPRIVSSLTKNTAKSAVIEIMAVAKNEIDKERLSKIFKPYNKDLILSWGIHPIALPLQFGIITSKGISKESGAKDIANYYNISFNKILGVGDTASDWQFIQLCGYAAAMGNASNE